MVQLATDSSHERCPGSYPCCELKPLGANRIYGLEHMNSMNDWKNLNSTAWNEEERYMQYFIFDCIWKAKRATFQNLKVTLLRISRITISDSEIPRIVLKRCYMKIYECSARKLICLFIGIPRKRRNMEWLQKHFNVENSSRWTLSRK